MYQMTLSKKEKSSGKDIMLGDKLCKVIESPGKITFFDPKKKEGVSIKGEFNNNDSGLFIKELEREARRINNFEIKKLYSPLHWLLHDEKRLKNSFFNAQYLYGTKKDAVRNLNRQQEKAWVSTKNGPSPNDEQVFARTIGNKKRFFKAENYDFAKDRRTLSFYPDAQSLIDNKPLLKREIRPGIGTGIVMYVAEHFNPKQNMREDIINGLIDNAVKFYDKKREENEIKNPQNSTQVISDMENDLETKVSQKKTIFYALKTGNLSCLPGKDGFADTRPAVNLVSGNSFLGTNLLLLKEHQKQNGFPTAEYLTEKQLDNAKKFYGDYAELSIRQGEKGISIFFETLNEKTKEWEPVSQKIFNIAQITNPEAMRAYAEVKQQDLFERRKNNDPEWETKKQKKEGSFTTIECTSTDPEKYLGQYFAAVRTGMKFKASLEQAVEFAEKMERSLSLDLFVLPIISNEANEYSKEVIREIRMAERETKQQEQKDAVAYFCYTQLNCEKDVLDDIIKNYVKDDKFDLHSIIPAGDMGDKSEYYAKDVKILNEDTIAFHNLYAPPYPIIYKFASLYEGREFNFYCESYDSKDYFTGQENIKCENGIIQKKGYFYGKEGKTDINENISIVDPKNSRDPEIQLAKKTGYVQGVCECVAAIVGNNDFGKKLLSEMNVTKDIAKKFASPETFKALEQGIFAPQPEQKLEQSHNIKR